MRRAAILMFAVLAAFAGTVLPATADDLPAPLLPPGVNAPAGGSGAPAGPTYEITPGVGGSDLPAPSDPDEAAQNAENAAQNAAQHTKNGDSADTSKKPGAKKARSTKAPDAVEPAAGSITSARADETTSEDRWLMIAAGALLLVVLTEFFRIRYRRTSSPV